MEIERDRLIGLLCTAGWNLFTDRVAIRQVADYLLANGVIVLPVKIGQTVYVVVCDLSSRLTLHECEVAKIEARHTGMTFTCMGGFVFDLEHLGDTVFLTREEAEQALAERSEQNG